MVKENKDFFLYVLGIIVLLILTVFLLDYMMPGMFSKDECGLLGYKCWIKKVRKGEMVYDEPPEMKIDTAKNYTATVETNYGSFDIDLYEQNAPDAVNNFVFLSNEGYYAGVKFHRVIEDLLVQTGDRNTLNDDAEDDGSGGPGYTFNDEINWASLNYSKAKKQQLTNLGYTTNKTVKSVFLEKKSVAMANGGPNSNGSQFFIITASSSDSDVKNLEGRHTVFGKVISGWEVIEKINSVEVDDPTSNSPRPVEDIVVEDIKVVVK